MSASSPSALPTFLVIGAMKAGTTSLYRYLADHPQVSMSKPKETHYFVNGPTDGLDAYRDHFRRDEGVIAIGEASASYTTYPDGDDVPARIAQVIPEAKLIYLVRDPIERMRSHYLQRMSGGDEVAPIDRALLSQPVYLETSRYAARLDRYLEYFPRERILVVPSENLRDDRRTTMCRIFGFLGVDESFWDPSTMEREFYRTADKRIPPASVRAVRGIPWARRMLHRAPTFVRSGARRLTSEPPPPVPEVSDATRRELVELLREDVRRLCEHIDPGFDGWGLG